MHACVCHFFVVSLQPFYKLTLMLKRNIILFFLLGLFASVVQAQSPVLCMDGTLLFREDFGGNDPNDPDVSMASVVWDTKTNLEKRAVAEAGACELQLGQLLG